MRNVAQHQLERLKLTTRDRIDDVHSEEFKREAVRIALTSGLLREQVVADLGIGKSTLAKWVVQYPCPA